MAWLGGAERVVVVTGRDSTTASRADGWWDVRHVAKRACVVKMKSAPAIRRRARRQVLC